MTRLPQRGRIFLSLFGVGLITATLWLSTSAQQPIAAKPRIDPAGIDGALLLSGKTIPPQAIERFITLAGGKEKGKVVVIHQHADGAPPFSDSDLDQRLKAELDKEHLASLEVFGFSAPGQITKEIHTALAAATGIWIEGSSPAKIANLADALSLGKVSTAVLKKGGVVAGSAVAAPLLAEWRVDPQSVETGTQKGLGLLPDALVGFKVAKFAGKVTVATALEKHPGLVGYEIDPTAALLVQGRKLLALGEGKVTIHLGECSSKPAKQIVLGGQKNADLTALRNAALARAQPEFPSQKPDAPDVKKGALIIVGGGGLPKGLAQKFVELAGGDKAVIVVLPTAQPEPLPAKDNMAEAFKKLGAKKVTYLKARKLKDVESDATLDILSEATGIWFGGGRQWGFVDAYAGTKAEPLLHEVLARGGVIGGSSAGASIQGEYMPRGDPLGNLNIIAEGYEKGLGFLKGVAIDQHFSQRKRHADMTHLMKTYPQLLGIGLDETTAITVKGHVAAVSGEGKVFFYDTNRKLAEGESDYEAVANGGSYDLKARKVLDKGQAHPK
jgi:cyanophycinase